VHAYVHQKKNKHNITRISSEKHINPPTATKKEEEEDDDGVFDGVAMELDCTPGGSVFCLVSLFYSSARPAGAKKGLSARLHSYAIFQRIAGAWLRWARGQVIWGDFAI
jgi:hypothetical protein